MDDCKRITRNLSFIKKNINEIDDVIDILIEEGVLGMGERNIILSDDDPIHSILEIILKKQAYDKFTKALRTTGNEIITTRLEKTDITLAKVSSNLSQSDQYDRISHDEYTDYQQHQSNKLQKELENLTKENNDLKQQQAQIRKELNLKQQKLLELNREACNYQRENLALSQRLSNLRKTDILNEIIDDREGELRKKDERNEEINNEMKLKNDEIQNLRNLLEELRIEVNEKSDQISMLNKEMKQLRDEHVSARRERRELKLKVENINNNFEEKMKLLLNVITENKTPRTPRQSTFTRLVHSKNNSRENTSLQNTSGKPSDSPRHNDSKIKRRENSLSPRTKISRPQQFISPQFVFAAKTNGDSNFPKPKQQWK